MELLMRLACAILVVLLAGIFNGAHAHGAADVWKQGVPVQVDASRVNVRAGPGTDHSVAGVAERGEMLRAFEVRDGWYQVTLPAAGACWVFAGLIDMEEDTATVASETLNVRAAPSPSAAIVGQVPRGTALRVIGRASGWVRVTPPAQSRGWMHSDFVRLDPEAAGEIPEGARSSAESVLAGLRLAEAFYLRGCAQKQDGSGAPDFLPAVRAYSYLLAQERGPDAMLEHCRSRLRQIGEMLSAADRKAVARKLHEERRRRQAELQQQVAEVREKIKREAAGPTFTAEGTVYRLAQPDEHATHRLKLGDITLYLLKGRDVDLEAHVGQRVGVIGSVVKAEGVWAGAAEAIISVERVHVLH